MRVIISQCCGCECDDTFCPNDPVDSIVVICPNCSEWTGVEFQDIDG